MKQLTRGEMEVMRVLWEHGEMKPSEIQERSSRPIKNSALRSYLTILVDKGHLTRRRNGKAYYYKAKTRRESAFRKEFRELADAFCGGSHGALVCHIFKSEEISKEELQELKQLAEEKIDEENAKQP